MAHQKEAGIERYGQKASARLPAAWNGREGVHAYATGPVHLSAHLSARLFVRMPTWTCVSLSVCLSVGRSIYRPAVGFRVCLSIVSICLSVLIGRPVDPSAHMPTCPPSIPPPPIHLSTHPSVYLSVTSASAMQALVVGTSR